MDKISIGIEVYGIPGSADVAGSCVEAGDAISPIVDLEALGSAWGGVEDEEKA